MDDVIKVEEAGKPAGAGGPGRFHLRAGSDHPGSVADFTLSALTGALDEAWGYLEGLEETRQEAPGEPAEPGGEGEPGEPASPCRPVEESWEPVCAAGKPEAPAEAYL